MGSESTREEQRPDASMTLLREILDRPHDSAYSDAVRSRESSGGNRSWLQEAIVLVLTIAIGIGGVWAARQLRTPVDSALEARVVLEEQIRDRSAVTDSLRDDISDLRAEIENLEVALSSPLDETLHREGDLASLHAGTAAVTGPGIEVLLTEPSEPLSEEEHVLDYDVQLIVNSLWAAGAEAVAVNDHRLSFGTAIRIAGEVILVDLEPIQNPYSIVALGDPDRITRAFAETPGADHLRLLNSGYRIGSSITQYARVELAAGNTLQPKYAEPLPPLGAGSHGRVEPGGKKL